MRYRSSAKVQTALMMALHTRGASSQDFESTVGPSAQQLRRTASEPSEFGVNNPTECLDSCMRNFIAMRQSQPGNDLLEVCQSLSNEPNTVLWDLYCCDSTFCGVWIDNTAQFDQSPNVDLIIAQCQSVGFYNITDPSPPPGSYMCQEGDDFKPHSSNKDTTVSSTVTGLGFTMQATEEVSASARLTPTSSNVVATSTGAGRVSKASPFSTEDPTAAATATSSAINTATTTATATALGSGADVLTPAVKAAIGVCSSIAIVAVVIMACLLQRRRGRGGGFERTHSTSSSRPSRPYAHAPTPSGSHTPLITPPPSACSRVHSGTPPPPRLSDRKFIQHNQDDPFNDKHGQVEELSPAVSPSHANTHHRHHRSHAQSHLKSPLSSPPITALSSFLGTVLREGGSYTASSSSSQYTPPVSPRRPPRPHDEPLEIPGLVKPDSHEPCAAPLTPLSSPVSDLSGRISSPPRVVSPLPPALTSPDIGTGHLPPNCISPGRGLPAQKPAVTSFPPGHHVSSPHPRSLPSMPLPPLPQIPPPLAATRPRFSSRSGSSGSSGSINSGSNNKFIPPLSQPAAAISSSSAAKSSHASPVPSSPLLSSSSSSSGAPCSPYGIAASTGLDPFVSASPHYFSPSPSSSTTSVLPLPSPPSSRPRIPARERAHKNNNGKNPSVSSISSSSTHRSSSSSLTIPAAAPTSSPCPSLLTSPLATVFSPSPGRHSSHSPRRSNSRDGEGAAAQSSIVHHPHRHQQQQQQQQSPPPLFLSAATREICDLNESYARETRDSWGSWSGSGGGGPGVMAGPRDGRDGSSSRLGTATGVMATAQSDAMGGNKLGIDVKGGDDDEESPYLRSSGRVVVGDRSNHMSGGGPAGGEGKLAPGSCDETDAGGASRGLLGGCGGGGGGGKGVVRMLSSRRRRKRREEKKAERKRKEELDLERLGGKY